MTSLFVIPIMLQRPTYTEDPRPSLEILQQDIECTTMALVVLLNEGVVRRHGACVEFISSYDEGSRSKKRYVKFGYPNETCGDSFINKLDNIVPKSLADAISGISLFTPMNFCDFCPFKELETVLRTWLKAQNNTDDDPTKTFLINLSQSVTSLDMSTISFKDLDLDLTCAVKSPEPSTTPVAPLYDNGKGASPDTPAIRHGTLSANAISRAANTARMEAVATRRGVEYTRAATEIVRATTNRLLEGHQVFQDEISRFRNPKKP